MKRSQASAYLYIIPIFALFVIFLIYPLFDTIYISLFDWNGFDEVKTFTGLKNYAVMFKDPVFYTALKNFIIFAFLVISLQMVLGFLLAYAMRRKAKLFDVYKAVIFVPVIILPVISSYVFNDILAFNDGVLNTMLRTIGLDSLALGWTSDPRVALLTVIAIVVWSGTGFSMAVYTSALSVFPTEVLEASVIDGTNKWQNVTRVVWPLLRDTHYSLTIIGATSALKIFDIIYLLTRGGPDHATEMLSTYMFNKAFTTYEQGFASAAATFMILLVLVVTAVQIKMSQNSN